MASRSKPTNNSTIQIIALEKKRKLDLQISYHDKIHIRLLIQFNDHEKFKDEINVIGIKGDVVGLQ